MCRQVHPDTFESMYNKPPVCVSILVVCPTCSTKDITSLRATSKELRAAFGAAAWRPLLELRFGTAALPPGQPDLQALMGAFSERYGRR